MTDSLDDTKAVDRNSQEWHDFMLHAFDEAADGIESWEYGGAESVEEERMAYEAAGEVGKRIRRMASRYFISLQ